MTDYTVKVKNGAGWREFSRIRLMISVGRPYHEDEKLAAVVNWINRNPSIQNVHISVNDMLQRHNDVAYGVPEDQAKKAAILAGLQWIERNQSILEKIKTHVFYTRWQEWLERPAFKPALSEILSHAQQDALFEEALAKDATTLANRKAKRGEEIPNTLVYHSRNYLEEEMAIFALQSAELPAAEVYPGSNLHAAEYLYKKQNLPTTLKPLAERHFTRIDFAKINLTPVSLPKTYQHHPTLV